MAWKRIKTAFSGMASLQDGMLQAVLDKSKYRFQIPLEGLREALLQMPAGSRWEVVLPGDKAYGTDIRAGRMANQAVVFDVKLVSVK